jgi:hypothetical protein
VCNIVAAYRWQTTHAACSLSMFYNWLKKRAYPLNLEPADGWEPGRFIQSFSFCSFFHGISLENFLTVWRYRCTSKFRVIIKVIWTIWSQVLATGLYAFERLQIVLAVFLAAVFKEFFDLIRDVVLTKLSSLIVIFRLNGIAWLIVQYLLIDLK